MNILEALRQTTTSIKTWAENKFLTEGDIDHPVDSVNGKTGAVQLTASDVGTLSSTTSIPQSLSDLTDDATHRTVSDTEKEEWSAKSDFSGNYNDLTNKPTIPSVEGLATETYVNNALNDTTADDFGIYVQANEPTDAVEGDIWIDTINDPTYIPPTLPEITSADNGKVLMVVNGTLQLVNLNLSVDTNGVVSM